MPPEQEPEPDWPQAEGIEPHVRRLRQRALGDRLRESLLFLPLVMLAVAIAVELILHELDKRWPLPEPSIADMPPDAAVSLLTTIAGATITTAGVVFSLLVVSLQLASGQFSPRVLRSFWRDRFGQMLIGLLLATFAFCVLALTQVNTTATRAPAMTLIGALVLTFAAILAIVAYLNRITRQQYVGRIAERIAGEALSLIRELPYGTRVGQPVGTAIAREQRIIPGEQPSGIAGPLVATATALPGMSGPPLVVRAPKDGWVQQISRRAVIAAVPPGSTVRLETRVGAFLVTGIPLATIWPAPPAAQVRRVARDIGEATIIGATRTMQQDIDFGLRQLNDISLRALSPAINDQTTAIELLLRVVCVMRPLLLADLPAQAVRDDSERTLLTPWDLDHAEYVVHAFDQLRPYAAGHPQVVHALIRSLRMLRETVAHAGGHEDGWSVAEGRALTIGALDQQIEALLTACEAAPGLTAADLTRIRELAKVTTAEPVPAGAR